MPSIYYEADQIATSGSRLLFGVSLGRDTAAMLHLMSTRVKFKDHAFVHWTPYLEMLPYQARLLNAIQVRYGIKVDVRPDPRSWLMKGIRSIADERDACIDKYGADFMCVGYRMDESLQRRGMLKRHTTGMDPKVREAYPLRSWTRPIMSKYIESNRIQLAPEYSYGLRDCRNHRGMRAVWLREIIGEADFRAAVEQDPQVEIDYVRNFPIYQSALSAGFSDTEDQ